MYVFAALWSLIIVLLDLGIGSSIVTHARTGAYPRTEGVIVASRVTNDRPDSDGTVTHGVTIEYTYAVGRSYRGTRYRGAPTSQSGTWASEVVAQFPVGARVPVFYAPNDPADAVLSAGLDGGDGFLPMFLLPFNAVALALWVSVRRAARLGGPDDVTGGLRVVEDGDVVRVLPETYPPAGMALLGAGFAAFLLIFVLVFPFGFDPPGRAVALAWAAIVVVAIALYARAAARGRTGAGDLVIDATARTLRFPLRRADPRDPIPWSSIASVVVDSAVSNSDRGSSTSYWVWVVLGAGARVRVRSTFWGDPEPAEQFRSWLEARVRPT
jgi:uncharacterized protein DUF3592